ncbi:MAG: hypothetical protein ABI999_15085 [Acidobacteriota bacterium]
MFDLNKSDEELEAEVKKAEAAARTSTIRGRIFAGALIVFVVAGFIITLVIGYQGAKEETERDDQSKERMDTNPEKAVAYLKDQYEQRVWQNGKKTYVLSYTFEANGHSYDGKCEVVSLPKQQTEWVYYDPQNPNMNKLRLEAAREGQITGSSIRKSFWAGALGKAVGWVIIYIAFEGVRRWRRK